MRPLVVVALLAAAGGSRVAAASASLVGARLPGFEGVDWASGAAPPVAAGRVTVVHLFRSGDAVGTRALAEAARRWGGAGDVTVSLVQWLGWRVEPVGSVEEGRALLARLRIEAAHGTLLGTRERAALAPAARWAAATLPWTVVADRAGIVRSEGPTRDAARLHREVESLRAVPGAANPLVGRAFGSAEALRTVGGAPFSFAGRPSTLLRWWTNGCPHCTASLPPLAGLAERHAARGLRLVAVYHPKGSPLSDAAARAEAARLGVRGEVVFDDRWAKYVELRERGRLVQATSISLLVDEDGVVRWVHPGPRILAGSSDLAALDVLVDRLLPPAPATDER